MSAGQPFVVNTIYVAGDDDVKPSGRLRALAVVTLIVSLAWLYVTWVPMYQWSQKALMFGELNIASGMMNAHKSPPAQKTSKANVKRSDSKASKKGASRKKARAKKAEARRIQEERLEAAKQRRDKAKSAQVVLAATAYGWLAVLSLAAFVLATASCAGLSSKRLPRTIGRYLLPVSIVICGAIVWYVWKKYEWYETLLPNWVRPTIVGLGVAVFGSIGFLLNRHGRRMHQLAGVTVVASALLSVAALWIAVHWGQMPSDQINTTLYAKVFLVQSAYGWFLLLAVRFS